MTTFRIFCETTNGITQVQLYAGEDALHMVKCGTLAFTEQVWIDFRRQILNKATGSFELMTQDKTT